MGISGEKLFSDLRSEFAKIREHRERGKIDISLTDCLMSGFAVFALKYESLLQFEEERSRIEKGEKKSNLRSLFEIQNIPSDTQMREILDPLEPDSLRAAFRTLFSKLQRRQYLKAFEFIKHNRDSYYLLPVDGTGYFFSDKIHCANCLTTTDKKTGEVSYQHQMLCGAIVHPRLATVIPLVPEPILKQDGIEKNDCEMNAMKRFIAKFRNDHPQLHVIVTTDALHTVGPFVDLLEVNQMSYILGVKPGSHEALFREIEGADKMGLVRHYEWSEEIGDKVRKKVTHHYRYKEKYKQNLFSPKRHVNQV